jgi:hypothetical protein
MPWQNTLSNDASRSFGADQQRDGAADPALGGEICPACPEELVLVEFADKPGTKTAFGGIRKQYVNLSSEDLVGVDPAITSAHQLGRTPPIVVKVSPPKSKTVTLRLLREDRAHGFPASSATLSGRENGLEHLAWTPAATATVTTDDKGEGKLEPGMKIPAMAGYKFKVEGRIDKKPFVRSGNAVDVKRRFAIRPIVRFASGQAAAFTAINAIKGDLEALDVESFTTATLTGSELGVREIGELSDPPQTIGEDGLASPASVKVFKPHAIAIIVGEFINSPSRGITPIDFGINVTRPAGGSFPASVNLPLVSGGFIAIVVPLTNGSQFVAASSNVTPNGGSAQALTAAEVSGLNSFSKSVTIDLRRFQTQPASVNTLTVNVRLKAITGWAVGWAYNDHPVIYLNMRDPNTDTILAADRAAALAIHEIGHKLHLTSDGSGSLPDQMPHHYPSFNRNGREHVGPHCSTGVPAGTDVATQAAHDAATCTMWGALKQTRQYCPECQTTLRKVDLSSGF